MPGTVFVFGSINADTSYRMTTLPMPGETVIAATASTSPGGKGANQAIAAAAAGAMTRMIGAVGDDAEAAALLAALTARGIDTASIATRPGFATGRAIVCVDDSGENSIVVLSGANTTLDATVAGTGLEEIAYGDVLVLQNEVPAAANRAAARHAQASGATVIWNAAPAPATAADLVTDIDLLVVNEHELKQIHGLLNFTASEDSSGGGDLAGLLTAVAGALEADAICTLGPDGAIYDVAGQVGRVPAPTVRAIDTTAAGDTVVGYLAAHSALPVEERLHLAASAGALTVTRAGASSSIPHLTDVERMLVALTERTPA
ncbi:PfkB family carbohydrate kinase [Cryobacterium sp. AP23]